VEQEQWVRLWPSLLILYGLLRIFGIWCRPAWITGMLIVALGTWWLLHNLGILPYDIWMLWPLILVFMGIGVMRRGYWGRSIAGIGYLGVSRRGRRAWRLVDVDDATATASGAASGSAAGSVGEGWSGAASEAGPPGSSGTGGATSGAAASAGASADSEPEARGYWWRRASARSREAEGMVGVDVFMSSVTRTVTAQDFKGGDIVAIMGGAEIDLRPARMVTPPARIEVNLLMGGLTLFVPPDWVVEFQGTPIMGGIDDQTHRPAAEIRGRLVMTGVVLLSGIVIRN